MEKTKKEHSVEKTGKTTIKPLRTFRNVYSVFKKKHNYNMQYVKTMHNWYVQLYIYIYLGYTQLTTCRSGYFWIESP